MKKHKNIEQPWQPWEPKFKNGDTIDINWTLVGNNNGGFQYGHTSPLKIYYPMPQFGRSYMVIDADGRTSLVDESVIERANI